LRLSLHRRLLLILLGSMALAWMATAFFTYLDSRQQINDMLDEGMIQSAELLLALTDRLPPEDWKDVSLENRPGQVMAYRIIPSESHKIIASSNMPDFSQSRWHEGFSDQTSNNEKWRIYRTGNRFDGKIEIAQRYRFRDQMAKNVAIHIIHPIWLAVPLLAILIWFSVRWGLSPLQAVTQNLQHRAATNLEPLASDKAPKEVLPLITALNKLFEQIRQSLEKERQFTDDAAHELRTPLAAIKTHAEIAFQTGDERERNKALKYLVKGTERAIRMVHQLLIMARLDHQSISLAGTSLNVNALLIETVIEETPRAMSKNIDLGISEETNAEATIWGNADLLKVMIGNLISNAVRYGRNGDKVTASVKRQGNVITVEITDTGPGIPPELLPRIFDRFYRIEGSQEQGSGLGLSIVSRIAEIHDAEITLTNNSENDGLTATVIFPHSGNSHPQE